jgi:hypothetical protein
MLVVGVPHDSPGNGTTKVALGSLESWIVFPTR